MDGWTLFSIVIISVNAIILSMTCTSLGRRIDIVHRRIDRMLPEEERWQLPTKFERQLTAQFETMFGDQSQERGTMIEFNVGDRVVVTDQHIDWVGVHGRATEITPPRNPAGYPLIRVQLDNNVRMDFWPHEIARES